MEIGSKTCATLPPPGSAPKYLPVVLETLVGNEHLDFDLYVCFEHTAAPTLYRNRSYPLLRSDLDSLRASGISTLYIRAGSLAAYQNYLQTKLLADPTIAPASRLCALKEVNRAIFMDALHRNPIDKAVAAASSLGAELADVVYSHEGTARELFGVLNHDYCTFTHVTNVCVYSVALAKEMGISDRDDLAAIATGALLHDVGKRQISPAILNKPEKLNDAEARLVRRHPQTGFEELCGRTDLNWSQLMMVYQHHERLDGRGYPVQVCGDEIDPWARICSIVDVFDALTAYRAYCRARTPAEALTYLYDNVDKAFDREMVECWNKVLSAQK